MSRDLKDLVYMGKGIFARRVIWGVLMGLEWCYNCNGVDFAIGWFGVWRGFFIGVSVDNRVVGEIGFKEVGATS